ncbi:hypothetical protein ACIQC9_06655 [Brevundimonas sp. NPDC092305]|uniref:hypothetical protein n=1 Tax=Brevundimonas sp. NPDC092305 TaxID=3363957 RepID=UPI003829C9C1
MIEDFERDESFEALKGAPVGSPGNFRAAYEVKGHPGWIIKESLKSHEANWTEFIVFRSLENESVQALFGHVLAISRTGRFLIMERLDNLTNQQVDQRPPPPFWLTDRKISGWGAAPTTGVIKIRDYGTLALGRTLGSAPTTALPSEKDREAARGLLDTINQMNKGD